MYSPSSSRSLIRSACSVVVLLGAAALGGRGAAAQQPDEALVSELARVLAAADARAFDPALFGEALRHPEPLVRRQAALAAGRIGDPAAVAALVEALGDSNQGVAAAAAFGLGLLKESRAVAPLLALVRSVPATSQGPPQTEAVTALARIGGDDVAGPLRELRGLGTTAGVATSAVQSAALLDAWRLGPGAPVPALIGYARDPDVTGRWHALYSLARLRVARAVTTLLDALQDPQPMVRAVAVRGVSRALSDTAKLAPQDVVTRIRPLLADRDAGVRVNTLRALATFRDSAFAGQAAPLAADADLNVAVAAETTLGVLGGGRAVEALQPGLTSPVFALRRQAVIALAQADAARRAAAAAPPATDAHRRGPPRPPPAARAAGDPFDDARLSAVSALGAIAQASADGRLAVATRFVARVPRADDYLVRRLAAERLPDAADGWGPAAPIATGRSVEDYRDVARRYLVPALRGRPAPQVTIESDRGNVVVELLPLEAPLTVAAFLALVDRRYFDGSRWHRVVPNFVVQDGDPRGDGWGGPGFVLRDELNPVRYETGAVGMALSGPDPGGSQVFITRSPAPRLHGTYTVFGRVVSGLAILGSVAQGERIRSIHR